MLLTHYSCQWVHSWPMKISVIFTVTHSDLVRIFGQKLSLLFRILVCNFSKGMDAWSQFRWYILMLKKMKFDTYEMSKPHLFHWTYIKWHEHILFSGNLSWHGCSASYRLAVPMFTEYFNSSITSTCKSSQQRLQYNTHWIGACLNKNSSYTN